MTWWLFPSKTSVYLVSNLDMAPWQGPVPFILQIELRIKVSLPKGIICCKGFSMNHRRVSQMNPIPAIWMRENHDSNQAFLGKGPNWIEAEVSNKKSTYIHTLQICTHCWDLMSVQNFHKFPVLVAKTQGPTAQDAKGTFRLVNHGAANPFWTS